jgi:hypothetical protein
MIFMVFFINFFTNISVSHVLDKYFWDDWNIYEEEKCIKIFDKKTLMTFDDAQKSCNQLGNGSTLLTIHSKEEQNLISNFLFKTHNIEDGIWLGLKINNNSFEWTDGSQMSFTNWAKGNSSNKTDHNCVQMISDSSPIGEWSDDLCNKKHVIVCEKALTVTITFLQKKIVELSKKFSDNQQLVSYTRKELSDTRKQLSETREKLSQTSKLSNRTNNTLNTYLNNLLSDKWNNFKLFTDSDGKHKALFFHINKVNPYNRTTWYMAKNTCESLNASLVEIQTIEKQFILESFLGQLGFQSHKFDFIWLNGHRESSGKWKWITSGKQFTYTNWADSRPTTNSGQDYIFTSFYDQVSFGKWENAPSWYTRHVVCEIEVHFQYILFCK